MLIFKIGEGTGANVCIRCITIEFLDEVTKVELNLYFFFSFIDSIFSDVFSTVASRLASFSCVPFVFVKRIVIRASDRSSLPIRGQSWVLHTVWCRSVFTNSARNQKTEQIVMRQTSRQSSLKYHRSRSFWRPQRQGEGGDRLLYVVWAAGDVEKIRRTSQWEVWSDGRIRGTSRWEAWSDSSAVEEGLSGFKNLSEDSHENLKKNFHFLKPCLYLFGGCPW